MKHTQKNGKLIPELSKYSSTHLSRHVHFLEAYQILSPQWKSNLEEQQLLARIMKAATKQRKYKNFAQKVIGALKEVSPHLVHKIDLSHKPIKKAADIYAFYNYSKISEALFVLHKAGLIDKETWTKQQTSVALVASALDYATRNQHKYKTLTEAFKDYVNQIK